MCIHIYIYRERDIYIFIYIISMYVYIYIYNGYGLSEDHQVQCLSSTLHTAHHFPPLDGLTHIRGGGREYVCAHMGMFTIRLHEHRRDVLQAPVRCAHFNLVHRIPSASR